MANHKDHLGEGEVSLPLNIDTKKYLFSKIAYVDLLYISPSALLSTIIIIVLWKTDSLSQGPVIMALLPTALVGTFQVIKHPIRKNITFLQYAILWKYKYRRRQKQFYYKKGELKMGSSEKDQDVRKKIGIKNVFEGTYLTTDNRLVKVLEVSSINMSLMDKRQEDNVYSSYRVFVSEVARMNEIQIEQIAQPINLSQYLMYVEDTAQKGHPVKDELKKSLKNYLSSIQKKKDMVTRKRYVIISEKVGSDRDKALEEIERKAEIVKTMTRNMLSGYDRLDVKILENDELTKLLYISLDYENAQSQGEHIVNRANNRSAITVGAESAKEISDYYKKQYDEKIM